MNPFLATDGYKTGHIWQYPENTTLVYSNFTPRSNKYAPKGCDKVVSFGQQMVMKQIKEMFDKDFFKHFIDEDGTRWRVDQDKDRVCQEIKKEYSMYLGTDYDVSHIEALWDLGYLPIEVKALPEGTLVPMGVPVLTIYNTLPEFYWLPNFLETLISNLLWKPMTSATIAHQYKKNLTKWALKTDKNNVGFVEFQGHDFSMRGMDSIDAAVSSGLGHATSFLGSDSLPVIHGARKYYGETEGVVHSVNATEHSVMCAGTKGDEIGTFRRLMKTFPKGILSIVSDTWDLWKVYTEYLPELKDEILARDGKIVIRPDSGDPVDILCGRPCSGTTSIMDITLEEYINTNSEEIEENGYIDVRMGYNTFRIYKNKSYELAPIHKGVIQLLWETFGGTVNEQGYKVLDSHIGAIYGDSITIDRAEAICERLEAKGFASTNVVLGVGSFTYQYNTRDTFGFAMKATYCEVMEMVSGMPDGEPEGRPVGREIFKDPITDDGTKKSAKGLLQVYKVRGAHGESEYLLKDQCTWEEESQGELKTIFKDGLMVTKETLTNIRKKLNEKL